MTHRIPLLAAAAIALLIIGASAVSANRGTASLVNWFEDPQHEPGPVAGAYAVQQRGYYSITTQIHAAGLTPGHRYTMWWAIYNNPASCVEGCDFEDVASAASSGANPAGIGVHYGGTFVAAAGGKMNIATRILEHAVVGCVQVPPYDVLCEPLIDAATAEAAVFVQSHGPATDAPLPPAPEMFAYGCKTYTRLDTVVTTYGDTGYDCFSSQILHLP